MKFSTLADYFQKLEKESSSLAMTEILAELIGEAELSEVPQIVYLSLGQLKPKYQSLEFGMAEKMLYRVLAETFERSEDEVEEEFKKQGDLGLVVEEWAEGSASKGEGLSVSKVYEKLLEIAGEEGEGSQERKVTKFAELLSGVEPRSGKYAVRIALGKLRLGFAEKTVIDALSWLEAGDKSLKEAIEKKYFIHPDLGEIARKFRENGLEGLEGIQIEVGVPIQLALCQREKTAEDIMKRMGAHAAAEYKLDGTRVQLHLDRNQPFDSAPDFLVKTFTRNLEETTHMFPEIVEGAAELEVDSVILDGEAIGYDPNTGEFLPFQVTVQRKRKYGVGKKAEEVPLKFFAFDVLFLDGEDMLEIPFSKRREELEKILGGEDTIVLTRQKIVEDREELSDLRTEAVEKGLEGLVVKNLDSEYEAGARGYSWIKFKREEKGELEDTIDAVVLGYYAGRGKRAEFGIGAFLVGVYNEGEDQFESIAKIGTGLTDQEWREMKERCDSIALEEKSARVILDEKLAPDVWTAPEMVVEVLADEITRSPVHTAGAEGSESGYALRFPRLVRWREDKSAEDATTVEEIKRIYGLQ